MNLFGDHKPKPNAPSTPNDVKSPLAIGQRVELRHRPSKMGSDIVIPATVVAVSQPYCWVDTPHQKRLKVLQKHLTAV
ncbi:hypothetical protein [Salmonirosea aquatica]|uniref:Uncharacterized protein n=1 Tax=Salmonirosea aquatica TaxID=2654236 RepID=A0A7C9F8M3_9BACT|nr:hypothetical protein [Cytophagaceae bacterium SJW1-29]